MHPRRWSHPHLFRVLTLVGMAGLAGSSVAVPSLAETRVYREGTDGPRHVFTVSDDHLLVRGAPVESARDWEEVGPELVVARDASSDFRVYRVPVGAAPELARRLRRDADESGGMRWAEPALLSSGEDRVHPVPGRVIVRLDAGVDITGWLDAASEVVPGGVTLVRRFLTPGLLRVEIGPTVDLFEALTALNRRPEVRYASPDLVGLDDALTVPNDPMFADQWSLQNLGQHGGVPGADVDALAAWEATRGDSLVLVAVIDQGVDLTHPDLRGNILTRPVGHDWSFNGPDSTGAPSPSGWHGTAVAGLVAAERSNAIGIAGLAPEITLLPLRVSLSSGAYAERADAIHYAASWTGTFDRVVINGSWKTDVDDPSIRAACEDALAEGCLLVFAAGNDGGEVEYPARYETTVAVGMTSPCDTRVRSVDPLCDLPGLGGESNVGASLDVVAPGGLMVSTDIQGGAGQSPGDYLTGLNGTSYAAPIVSAVAALVWSVDPTLSPQAVRQILRDTAADEVGDPAEDVPGFDPYHGYGRVDAFAAVMATGAFRAQLSGTVRAATDIYALSAETLSTEGDGHEIRLGDRAVDAQTVAEAHVSVYVEELTLPPGTRLEIGLITEAQRARALDHLGNPASLLGHSVMLAVEDLGEGVVAGATDGTASPLVGLPLAAGSSLDLVLVPDPGGLGGVARLYVDGVAGPPVSYGEDDWDDDATRLDGEDLTESRLVVQMVSVGEPASVSLRHLRVSTHAADDLDPVAALVRVEENPADAVAADPATGAFALSLDAFRELTVTLTADGFLPDTLALRLDDGAAVTLPVGLLRAPSGALTGTVTVGGVPTDGIEVRLVPAAAAPVVTDLEGRYERTRVPVGRYDLRFLGAGFGPVRVREVDVVEDGVVVVDGDVTEGFDDDLEHGAGYWAHLPGGEGWLDEWTLDTAENHTPGGSHAFVCQSPGGGLAAPGWSVLELPPLVVRGDERLWLRHHLDVPVTGSTAENGGRFEVSPDGGASWAVLEPQGGYPQSTGFDHTGPFGGDAALFAGTHGWRLLSFDLSGFAGDTLRVRAVLAITIADPAAGGWAIDDVQLLPGDATVDVAPVAVPTPGGVGPPTPNPFRSGTSIPFEVTREGRTRLTVYDVSGRRVVVLLDERRGVGRHAADWDGRDGDGRSVASGVYYVRLETDAGVASRGVRRLR